MHRLLYLALISNLLLLTNIYYLNPFLPDWPVHSMEKIPEFGHEKSPDEDENIYTIAAAKKWDAAKITLETKKYLLDVQSSQDAAPQKRALQSLGVKTHPTILGLVRDPALYARLVKPTGENILPEAPFNRACDLLENSPSPEFVDPLLPFLKDPSSEIRRSAAFVIGKIGSPAIIPAIRVALADQDENVHTWALMGLEYSLKKPQSSPDLGKALFPDVQILLRAGKNADHGSKVLLLLDRAKALDFFLSKEILDAKSPILHEILKTLANSNILVPRDSLKILIKQLDIKDIKFPQTRSLGQALLLLGRHRDLRDQEFLLSRSNHPDNNVAIGASGGTLALNNLEGFLNKIFDIQDSSGYNALNQQQKYYLAAFICHNEVNNGGFSQFFLNSSGDHWQDAVAGFNAMGFAERSEILNEAVRKFGKEKPSTNRKTRIGQLADLTSREETVFYALETRYYDSKEIFEVISARYVLKNSEAFGGKK